MFVEYNEEKEKPFMLNILMDKAQEDLYDMIKKIKMSGDKMMMSMQ